MFAALDIASGRVIGQTHRRHRAWFATLTQRHVRRSTHRSTRQLEQAPATYVQINNDNPKPFVWTKSADDILASIERFCLRTSNSRH